MLRRCGLALSLLAATIACNKTEGGSAIDAPDAAVAGTEQRGSTDIGTRGRGAESSAGARALVAVVSTSASEAEPCERTCGRVGDCLFAGDEVSTFEAGRLELECLDLCVHTPESRVRTAFLGCEQQAGCGPLLECTRSHYEKLAETRRGPVVEGIVTTVDPCKDGCRWLYACAYTGAPPNSAYMPPELEENIRYCENQCESLNGPEREIYERLAECVPRNCSIEQLSNCY